MDSPVIEKTEPSDAAAITAIFEQATGYTLTHIQREHAQHIVMELSSNSSVMDFVSLAEQIPELKKFASAIQARFANNLSPAELDEA